MSTAPKSPAELMADLTDQVRLLRQDVGNLTASAPTKAEAARLMASVQKAAKEAFERSQEVIRASEHLGQRMHRDSASAAQAAAEKAIKGLEDEIQAAANHMRAEALRGRREAFYSFGGGLAVYGGMIALGAVLGIVLLLLIQGRGDAHSFGRNPGLFCTTAGGERGTTSSSGEGYCVFWTDR
ncbi:hypothetical protein [Paracoccus marcusii]|jgi:hypothetical protein|uniref:hypothetical protein n=1 Tax=Paracoccus marcusii TaxID=59779 RepID=UPI00248FA15F|nr:hypothetical protein [Paracoccus marcusii]